MHSSLGFTCIIAAELSALVPVIEAVRVLMSEDSNDDMNIQKHSSFSFLEQYYDVLDRPHDAVGGDQQVTAASLIGTNATDDCGLGKSGLDQRFKDMKAVGKGKNGCVVVAKDTQNGDMEVAIKVAKGKKSGSNSWSEECGQAQKIHQGACQKGPHVLKLAEAFLPTCLEAGSMNGVSYMVMHSAAGPGMAAGSSRKKRQQVSNAVKELPKAEKISIFAQTISALAAMHLSGFSHNDMHFENILLLKGSPHIALIDFGTAKALKHAFTGNTRAELVGDGTLPARLASQLAGCPQLKSKGDPGPLFDCLKEAWSADDEFLKVFGDVMAEAKLGKQTTLVPALYHTKFIQNHLPPLKSLFPLGRCQ